jgi:hypothetical protein
VKLSRPKNLRAGRGDERRMRHAGNRRDVLHGLDVRCARIKEVVGDKRADRLAAKLAVLSSVDVLVQAGLNDFRAVFEIVEQVLLGRVENLEFDVLAEVGAVDQQLEAAPGGFQRLELLVVENLVHLTAEFGVNFRDHTVDHGLFDWLMFVLWLEQFFDEGRHAALGNVISIVIGGQFGFGDDAVEDA